MYIEKLLGSHYCYFCIVFGGQKCCFQFLEIVGCLISRSEKHLDGYLCLGLQTFSLLSNAAAGRMTSSNFQILDYFVYIYTHTLNIYITYILLFPLLVITVKQWWPNSAVWRLKSVRSHIDKGSCQDAVQAGTPLAREHGRLGAAPAQGHIFSGSDETREGVQDCRSRWGSGPAMVTISSCRLAVSRPCCRGEAGPRLVVSI